MKNQKQIKNSESVENKIVVVDFNEKIFKEFGFKSKSRSNNNSIFSKVKSALKEKNQNKQEVIFKVLTQLKNENIEINEKTLKTTQKLLSNLLTYIRKSYKGYESFELIEKENHLQMI